MEGNCMYIVYGHIEIFIPYSSSLKEKRKIIHSIVDRVRKRFNISISEVKHHDLWQRSIIGFTAVSSNHSELELIINAIKDSFYNNAGSIEIIEVQYDIISHNFTS
jgi:hypothetical protein